ncbi:unnamed protein product [Pieris macdunnoughi]|uniref:CCD97-like C-terminal domain-containing protein n=1 Tax=Pieris macdunnoughi TaxID=345717 RepID=A0A821RXV9_9NEOP|nr:unnamed protein product [Pieris macdunnoughi]
MDNQASTSNSEEEYKGDAFDPIYDIIDYLVRCAKVSFKNSHVNEKDIRSAEKTNYAYTVFIKSPTDFLVQYGKFLCPNHIKYFEDMDIYETDEAFKQCVSHLKFYHSEESRNKRVRNRRYKALQNLQDTTDYFSEKQMMFRNPLLYEQLIGQFLTDEEIQIRDSADNENLTLLSLILDTVDRNQMRETKNVQMLLEDDETSLSTTTQKTSNQSFSQNKKWGDFDIPDTRAEISREVRKQTMIDVNERNLMREEFLQEMYSSFIEGRDIDFDYNSVDSNDAYDDLEQISQDAEDQYFDSEMNDSETLEEHMSLVHEYSSKKYSNDQDDPLDVFMKHITNKLNTVT